MSADTLRRMGRPDQQGSEELARHLIETAARLFIERGYAATSIEQIAAAAGCGKQTLYRRFTSKEGMFTEVINHQGQRLIDGAVAAETTHTDPIEALKDSCRLLFNFMLQPDMVSLYRIMVAEIGRFPELGDHVLNNCLGPFKETLNRLLSAARDAGRIRTDDLELTHALMMGLLTGWTSQQSLLSRRVFATTDERDAFFEAAWAMFLRGAR